MNQITTLGMDTAKSVFHLVGLNQAGTIVLRKKLRRQQVLRYMANLPPTLVGIETCGGSHYWGRELSQLGHQVRLLPARDVKALVRTQKNDYHDALALAEAVHRPNQRFVPLRPPAEQELQALHRLRRGVINERTALANRVRGLLAEFGIVMPTGLASLRRQLAEQLDTPASDLGPRLQRLLRQAQTQLQQPDAHIAAYDAELTEQLRQDETAQRLLTIPGFGPVLASVWRARIGDGDQFRRGRDAAAALGLVPRQYTSGDQRRLLGITKTAARELRTLLVHGARAVVSQAHRRDDALSCWINQLKARRGAYKATVALANKLARIAWAATTEQTLFTRQPAIR